MKYDDCCECAYFRYAKYPTQYCEKIMMSVSDIDVCPKNKREKHYIKTEAQYQALKEKDSYEDLSYDEKLKIGFDIIDGEEWTLFPLSTY